MHPGAKWVLRPVRDGEWWNVVESNAALSVTAFHRKPGCRQRKGCAGGGGQAGGSFDGGPKGAPVRTATEGNLPLVKAEGNLVEVLGGEVRRQGT